MRRFIRSGIVLGVLSLGCQALWSQVFMKAELTSAGTGSGSKAEGTVWAVLSADMSKLTYEVTYANLEGSYTVSHFHYPGGLTAPLTFNGTTASGEWTGLTGQNIQDLLKGRVYVNVHSTVAPGGEIRGFLNTVSGIGFTVSMDGSQAGTGSSGRGTAWVVLDSSNARIEWHATVGGLSDTITAAHFHYPGGVFSTPFKENVSSGKWSAVPDSIVAMFAQGGVYMNVHTRTFPGGEIRGTVSTSGTPLADVKQVSSTIPASFRLDQNYPNPFNPSTTIQFTLARPARVSLRVFNLLGQEVATLVDEVRTAGSHQVTFDARNLASGAYFYRLTTDAEIVGTKRMLFVK